MEGYDSAVEKIRAEIMGELQDVKKQYLQHFGDDLERFIDSTAQAMLHWLNLDESNGEDESKAVVSGLVFSAITQHIISMRLFLTGYIVAAGNIQRQVITSVLISRDVNQHPLQKYHMSV